MGNSALACFGGAPSSARHPERVAHASVRALERHEIFERSLVVDIDAPTLLPQQKSVQLKICTAHFQRLAQLPLRVVKQIALKYIQRSSAQKQQRNGDTNCTITVVAPQQFAGLSLHITASSDGSAATEEQVFVQFASDTSYATTSLVQVAAVQTDGAASRLVIQLQLCARCGASTGCACAWRSIHCVSLSDEKQSLLEAIDAKLPRAGATAATTIATSYRMRLVELARLPVHLEAAIFKKKVAHPMVERPYAVYAIEVRHGEMNWEVTRRYQDFVQLHMRLTDTAPTSVLPELPRTKWVGTLDDTFLFERQVALSDYLKGVLMVESVQSSVPLLSFLGALSTTSVDHEALTLQRRDVLHLRVLSYYAEPGDLVLFRCCGPVSGIQRSVTGSEWDHVGVVVPGHSSVSLHLLEATGDGVTSFPLTSRLVAYSAFHIQYIALRKLHTPLITSSARFDLLRRFACEVDGKPYGLSVRKLLRTVASSEADTKDFFCSELAAEAFKALGIIHPSIPSSTFWPGSFTSGGFVDSELARHGAALEPEVLIDCRLLEVAMAKRARRGKW